MKIVIASDIHGSAYYCEKLIQAFHREQSDLLVLLGDILYHGPRNDLPREYDPKQVFAMLNTLAERIQCVRGNCDAEVDQMVLQFPILQEISYAAFGHRTALLTHGHKCGETMPAEETCPLLLCGHTHVPKVQEYPEYVYLNPGSVSLPKDGSSHSYLVYEKDVFTWKDLDGMPFMQYVCCVK